MTFSYIVSIFFLIFGFGFVIFWHELGHFLAAKKSGIRVEQFAVGMGHAIFSWRKGIGFRTGNTQKEYEKRAIEQWEKTRPADADGLEKQDPSPAELATAATEAGLGDTEYRLNWIPIGGYVKMLGQDDMDATSVSDDPRSYNRKSIGARMFVVSAGVIMNVILAAIGFMILFLVGFNVSPSVVGHITPGSPAWQAGFQVGDRIVSIDGNDVEPNFTKVVLNSALLRDGDDVPVKIKRNGQPMDLRITPRRPGAKQLVALGIGGPVDLSVPEGLISSDDDKQLVPQDRLALNAGDTIVSVNGKPVEAWTRGKDPKADKEVDAGNSPKNDYAILDEAIQKSFGEPVNIDVVDAKTKKPRTVQVHPRLDERFGEQQIGFAGMIPRASVHSIDAKSPAKGKLLPNDVVVGISFAGSNDKYTNVSERRLRELLATAGTKGQKVTFTVLRDGKEVVVPDLATDFKIDQGTGSSRGLGIGLAVDADHLIVADLIKDGPAEVAKIPLGAEILSVGGKPVKSWNDVYRQLSTAKAGEPIDVSFKTQNTDEKPVKMSLSAAQLDEVKSTGYTHDLPLAAWIVPQKTSSPLIAAKWGVLETRDFIFQFYVTLRRFADGTVSPTNAMGPVGIISAGTSVASRGNDWMLWFLCMISANLAVVNFLPIPVVDGGLFMFLVLEKIKGKPLSPRAQQVAQVTGLILLASVFLFVTYNDITRHL